MNVTSININDSTNGNISKEGEHHYAQYRYEVQLPGGIVVKDTSTSTLPREMAQMDAAEEVLAKLQAFGYKTKHCVKEMHKWQHNQQSVKVEGGDTSALKHQLNPDGPLEDRKPKCC